MIVLADSDIVRKLAYCELLEVFLQVMGVPPDELWVLPALKFQMKAKLAGLSGPMQNFTKFLGRVRTIPAAEPALLMKFTQLDVGEQQLFALLCGDDRVRQLVTGDKRAIIKASNIVQSDSQVEGMLVNKTIRCFESVLCLLVAKRGFAVVNAAVNKCKMIPGLKLDGVLSRAFALESESHCNITLCAYIDELKKDALGLNLIR